MACRQASHAFSTNERLLRSPAEALDPIAHCEERAVQQSLYDLVGRLPHRLRDVIVARYGMDGRSPAFYRQIGAWWGLSYKRVRQLHEESLV